MQNSVPQNKSHSTLNSKPTREDVSQYFEQHKNILSLMEAALHDCILQFISQQGSNLSETETNYKALNYLVNYIKSKTTQRANNKTASQKMKEIQEIEIKEQMEKNEVLRKEIQDLKSKYEELRAKHDQIQANHPLELEKIRKQQQEQKEQLHSEIQSKQKQVEELLRRNTELKARQEMEKQALEDETLKIKYNLSKEIYKLKQEYESVLPKEILDQMLDLSTVEPSAAKQHYLHLFSLFEKQIQSIEEQNASLRHHSESQKEYLQKMRSELDEKGSQNPDKQLITEPIKIPVEQESVSENIAIVTRQDTTAEDQPLTITVQEPQKEEQLVNSSSGLDLTREQQNLSFVDESFYNEDGEHVKEDSGNSIEQHEE